MAVLDESGSRCVRHSFLLPKFLPRENAMNRILEDLMALDLGKPWRVTIEEAKSARSDLQNNALWGVAYTAILETGGEMLGGWRNTELHEYFCGEYFGWVDSTAFGARKKRPRRTTTTDENGRRSIMGKLEFVDFYSFIQQRMAEHSIIVPDPDPDWRLHREEQAA